jgi:glycosyltransferase involved in cell wall biosynthesis
MVRPTTILLLSPTFPADPVTSVSGAFQRLQRHIEVLARFGTIHAGFFWPVGHSLAENEQSAFQLSVRRIWPIGGTLRFIPADIPKRYFDFCTDAVWAFRGALTFFHAKPGMRTSGHNQAIALRNLIGEVQPDLIFAHRLGTAACLLRAGWPPFPVIFDLDDLDDQKLTGLARITPNIVDRYRISMLAAAARRTEARLTALATRTLVCSSSDERKLATIVPTANVAVIPNAAHSFGELGDAQTPTALFVGVAHYPPNREAILWLVSEIWPRVRSAVAGARLLIVGSGSEHLGIESSANGVEILGFVPHLGDVYRQARLALCPIRRGSGTRIKIIEAAMNARPVVSTAIGAEGLLFELDSEILIADSTPAFSSACISLLRNSNRARTLGRAAQRRAQLLYSPTGVASQLMAVCGEVLGHRGGVSRVRATYTG